MTKHRSGSLTEPVGNYGTSFPTNRCSDRGKAERSKGPVMCDLSDEEKRKHLVGKTAKFEWDGGFQSAVACPVGGDARVPAKVDASRPCRQS